MTTTDLLLYNKTARASAATIIRAYSTSFGWASRLLDSSAREDIACIYALVRIADEVVDGPAEAAGADLATRTALLDELESETERALHLGFSANLIVHAFALTARAHGIGVDLCRPFFASMRRDLSTASFDATELDEYIYGSAEVVGLMCLAVFESGAVRDETDRERLEAGARSLGAAFQKVNFLRDLAPDRQELGRAYFPGTETTFTEESKSEIIGSIREDLRRADQSIPLLRSSCRAAVWAARAMFGELTHIIEATPVTELMQKRASVATPVKARIMLRALRMKTRVTR